MCSRDNVVWEQISKFKRRNIDAVMIDTFVGVGTIVWNFIGRTIFFFLNHVVDGEFYELHGPVELLKLMC